MTIELSVLEAVALSRAIAEYVQTATDADRRQIVYAIRSRILKKLDAETALQGNENRPVLGLDRF